MMMLELTSFNDNVTCEKCLEEIKKGFKFDGIYETPFMDSIKPIEEINLKWKFGELLHF